MPPSPASVILICLGLLPLSGFGASYYDAETGVTYTSGTGYAAPTASQVPVVTSTGRSVVTTANPSGDQVRLNRHVAALPPTVVMAMLGPILGLSQSAVTWGTVLAGTSGGTQTVTLTNRGDMDLAITGMGFAAASTDFSATNDCPASLAPGATCQVRFQFNPIGVGTRAATYDIKTKPSRTPIRTVSLSGTGKVDVYSWKTAAWTPCTTMCGTGSQSRSVWCQRQDGATVASAFCGTAGTQPPTWQSCTKYIC